MPRRPKDKPIDNTIRARTPVIKPEGKKIGRPKIKLDWDVINDYLKAQCTNKEIAGFCRCSVETLERLCRKEHGVPFADYAAEKKEGGKASLRRIQFRAAEEGSGTMQVWLGKQYLDQSDKSKTDLSSSDGTMSPKELDPAKIIEILAKINSSDE